MDWEVRAASLILCLGILLATIHDGIAERRIVCYYTNWSVYRPGTAKFSPQNINPYLCTHLIYAFGGFTKENALKPFDKYQDIEKGGYAKFTGLKTYNKNLKTMLAIGGWNEGSSRFSPMVADPARRREFIKNSVKFLRQNHFDGLDLDWEYPAFRDGGKPRDKDNYADLVQELRKEFERESSKTGRSRLLLSMAMPAGVEYIDKGYDVPRLNEYLDFINLLSYDYHSAYEPAVNHHSPLYPLEEDNEYNYDAELTIDYTITHLLEKGASADKVVLGIPTYGRSYTLFNQDATELGSPADGPGTEGEATREKGYLAYYEICESIADSDEWEVVQPNPKAMGPYAFKGNQWVGYDDEDIVKLKAHYVNEKKLGGIMFWSIDNDDFRGKCHGRPYPLIEAAKEALLTDNSRNTIDKTKSVDSRKKTRTQNTQSSTRKSNISNRRSSTTSAPIISKRVSSSRPKYRTISQASKEEQEDREVSRRSYDPSSDEDTEGRNTVRVTEKIERPKSQNRSKTQSSAADRITRRKHSRRKGQNKTENEESISNKLTTPEPPTTPDPGTDFKCEDEGFFPHPRDCKKYFWCLDSGPGGLGVVAHQFTCPSGLVFNKGADSCDYPRNVICPKTSKTSIVSTTRSPITAATSRTTYLHSTTTAKVESEEYDSEEDDNLEEDDEIEEDEEVEEEEQEEKRKEEPMTTTTTRPLVYKTLTRNRPSTTTTTTTTSKPSEPERVDSEDEEDPRVIKELIDLIKKAGGIEELEKQLLFQEKNSDTKSGSESVTPATISRSLYERVLNRQTNRIGNHRPVLSSSETSYVNGPGRAQFEGLDDIPEVKSLRRSQKPQYVTIERSKSITKESLSENEDINEDEEDNTDVASSEGKSISNPLEDSLFTQRVTPSYVNIRRTRPSITTSKIENDVEGKEIEIEEEKPTRRRRPIVSLKQHDNEASSETSKSFRNRDSGFRKSEKREDKSTNQSADKDNDSSTTKTRYSNIQRFRSTTLKTSEGLSSIIPLSKISETTSPTKLEEYPEVFRKTVSTTASLSTTPATTTSTSTEVITTISVEPPENPSNVSSRADIDSTTDSMKLVEDSATEILFTTLPAISSSSSQSTTTTTTTLASRSTIAAVSQPRPFGFTRRRSGSLEATTTATTPLSRSKVSITPRHHTRPSNPVLGRVRLRTKPVKRVTEEELVDQVDIPHAETSTSRSKDLSRSYGRGSSRYTPPTSRSKTQDVSANFVPSLRYRERGRTTASTTVGTVTIDDVKRRYRRPSRVNNPESITVNELDDSPIVRITQGGSRKNPLYQSRSDEENNKITNIRIFRKPTVNRELYDRTKYTRKRNNVEESLQKVNNDLNQKHIASMTLKAFKTGTSAETDRIEGNDLLNGVDQSTAKIDSVVESNTIQPIYDLKPITQIDGTTISSNKVNASNQSKDTVATTTTRIEIHEFNPDLVTIVSTERVFDVAEKTSGTPRKRKIFLRKRPISSSTVVNIIETEEEETSQGPRRRKVIKRKRPLQNTSTSMEVSLEEEEDSSLLLKSTTPMGSDEDVEKSTVSINQTEVTLISQNTEESTIVTGLTGLTREIEDSTSTVTETTLSTDYNSDGFMKVTLETPAIETTTISGEDILSTATIPTINTDADEIQRSTIEMDTEVTIESTLATATTYNTESMFLEDTLIPSTEAENLSTTRVQTTLSTSDSDSATTRTQVTTTPFTTESDSFSAARSSSDSRYARKKFIRKNPVSSSGNTNNQYIPALSSTENSSLEILSKRKNYLFIGRYPVSSSTVNILYDDLKYKEEKEGEEKENTSRSRDLARQDIVNSGTTLRNKSILTNGFSDDTAEFWKHYTTTSLRGQINYPSAYIEDVEDRKVARTEFIENNTYRLTPIVTRGPEIRPRYKVPIILKRPFDPEEALSPRRYPPIDSAPEESEETPETRDARLRQSGFRQPRMRYKLLNRNNVKIEEKTTQPSPESTSTWQYFRTRSYPKRTSTSTEAAVTETLIPMKKFDYVADAFHRKQQSLRTTTLRSNDFFDSQNLIDPYYTRTTVKPSVTRLVTSVTESGTTERQKILIKTKYSSLTSTTRIPADQFPPTTPLSTLMTGVNDDSANEVRHGVERSTLPIEGEFNYRHNDRFTTESYESSTIEIESVADSEAIRLPTLKELIGYPTTYYDDRTATTSSSVLLHLLRNDVDNDISRQNVEELLRGTDESQDGEKKIAQSPRDIIEETGDLWLQQASENRARSRTLRKDDVTNFDERVSVTNTIQEDETKRKTSTNSIYLKPTTMRGISLVSLISSPVMRGFYITRSENVSSILMDSSTPLYTTTDIPVEQQTETILISDVSMTDGTVTVAYNDQIESGPNILDDNVNISNDKGIGFREEKYSVPNSSMTFSNAEISNHKKSDLITILVDGPTPKRGKLLRNFDHMTPLFNSYVASSTTPTRRKIAIAVNRYNEAITPLWTGRRIVAKKRNRTTVSPIKDAIRRTESDSIYALTNTLRSVSLTTEASTLASRNKLPTASTISTTSLTEFDDFTASPEILSVYNNLANSNAKIEDSKSNVTETMTLTNSIIATTPSIFKTIPTNATTADISTFSDDSTIMNVPVVNASVTSSTIAVSKASTVAAELTIIYTPTTISTEIETTPNYSVTDNPIIENAILTDPATTITFAVNTESEIPSTNVNIIPETTTIVTDHVTTVTNTGVVTIPVTANAQEIVDDSTNMTRVQIANANIGTTSSITNYFTDAIPTTISMHDVVTDSTLVTAASATAETFSITRNYSTFTTVKNATIPITTLPLTTVIPLTVNTQHIHATTPMTTNNLADINTVTTNIMTTPLNVIIPTITDLNVITSPINTNIPFISSTSEISPITIRPKNSSVTSPKALITNTDITSTSSAVSTILTPESSTIHLANSSNFNISSNSEILAVTTIAETTEITEIPITFEIPSTFTSTVTAYPKPHSSTNFEALSVVTATLSTQGDENSSTPIITQTPSTPFSITTLITNKTTVAVEKSTAFTTPFATTDEFAINSTIQTTTDTYESDFVQTISEESLTLEQKTDFKETTSMKTQSQTEDQTIATISKLSSAQTMRNEFTAPEIKVSEETISKITENQKQNQTILELNTTNYQFSQKTAKRRVLNRTNNWLGSPTTPQRTNEYPRRQVTLHRRRSQRPATHISSSKAIEKNRERRIIQKRIRINSKAFNNTIRSDQDTVDVQNITDYTNDQVKNMRRRKVVLKKRVKEEMNTILPTEETTVFLQTPTIIGNETLQTYYENENIKEKQEVILKQSEESLSTTKNISTNSSSANESFPDNIQNNLYVPKDFSKLENPKNKPKSEEKNLIEGERVDFDSINTNLRDNFPKSSYSDKNLSDKRITRRRMRVVLKNVRSKIEEKNSTIEEINVNPDFANKNFQNNFLNNQNISQNFSNEEKTRRKMRVKLKRIKSKSEEEETKTEKAGTEDDFTNESLQGTFSNNFYSAKNFPVEYRTRRRMRVVLKSVKPKTEEKNPTVEEITVEPDSINENLQGTFSNNFRNAKNLPIEYRTRRMRVVLKSVKLKSDLEKNSTVEGITVDPNFTNGSLRDTFSNNFRKNFPVKHGTRRRMRVALKSIKPRSEEKNSTVKETSVNSDSNFSDKDFQDSFLSNLHENLFNGEDAQRRMEDALKSVKPTSKERDSVAEETNVDSNFARKDSQVLNTLHFLSNLHMGDNLPDKKKMMKHSKSEEKEAMIKQPEDTESQTTRTSVPVEKDTDRFSLEVMNGKSINRNSESGHSNRRRKPTPFTTIAPLTNTLSNTVYRRRRPVETTISSRIDFVDAFEGTESYVKPAAVLHDQNADVSDQSIRAQEFAVTLSDPPSSTSDIGQTPLRDVDRRKISTTVIPRTDPTTSRTVSRYDTNFRSRQRSQTKDRATVNATTRPRRPPVIDYDYYEDEAPIVIGKSVLNSKLFLTSKGTIRCMDQGNFPHPYSCKKFITCARMVNGQVIGTEYTCPDKLSFDPVGGICNWSAGLGCKD
ncbi:PREDICTED: uncharacterized threonine-rich GPI-anchored glycoprotein PJ4664.02-like [Trachymyrmex cornetzi]|uniref:uncharacterized threonine-rich GPI-anchored glycoprotein PJ4664.02-like n=1 Tax=Trachymyrmex cornetzi TaxID=471704 RepID=UPI00084F1ACD|nr:PREDICTED: uncharacterized threonine-rich GPI-anchored glycoprotein PJ4664.02-like [Trachymyrmex cornetzi]